MQHDHPANSGARPAPTHPEQETSATAHAAEECRSLRCPLHAWRCNFNGDLAPAAEQAGQAG